MKPQRIIRPSTAFSVAPTRQRRPRDRDEKRVAFIGRRFGQLEVIGFCGPIANTTLWRVRCDCGTEKTVRRGNLLTQKSCGCLARKRMSQLTTTHGLTKPGEHHPLYGIWDGMKRRCHGKNPSARYGGRGIAVCDRWRFGENGKTGFECFLADMGARPSPSHSIDRKNNDGPYSPENCRWATVQEQQRNRSSNTLVNFSGRVMPLIEAVELSGLRPGTVASRIYHLGWTPEEALNTSVEGK